MGKSVVVTGAGGYIGRHVVSALLGRGLEVKALDVHLEGVDKRAERLDLALFSGDPDIYAQMGRPDAVIHLAWRDGFKHSSSAHLDDLPKHYHLVNNLYAGGLKQLAVMGSMHEVGYWEGAIDEHSPCAPASLYGISKNALREITRLAAQANDAVFQWIRAYYIVGDDKFGSSVFSKLLAAAQEGKQTFPFTSGKNRYDFISVDRLAAQIAAIVDQDAVTGVINACTGEPMSLAERVETYIKDNHLDIRLEYGAFPDRPYDSPGVWGDPTKIRAIMAADRLSD
ncbi:UDP-glucose 4-epimerase [Actinomyces bovis]|uniref:UDP-glucose 4-epimerase n=1 Tax=Actinomyces bovis TaxID=1658 RepID=A0ABY1VMH6_9ACTO|nr:NAD(P)-dependent oxidoreductase [Actinomyces bovis]SPT53311.1 UDP-glucose 4-epimerase [Actinomyces bovis]VEG52643.1 UDP-glucose 4-epimerase [Actinomyces israelii]